MSRPSTMFLMAACGACAFAAGLCFSRAHYIAAAILEVISVFCGFWSSSAAFYEGWEMPTRNTRWIKFRERMKRRG